MNTGKVFETNFKKSIVTEEVYYQRIKDSPSAFGYGSTAVRFTADNPYDAFCFYDKCFFALEMKHSEGKSFSIQRNKEEKGKMIKLHQIKGLSEVDHYVNAFGGFLFDTEQVTYWLNIRNFNKFINENDKKSINIEDIKSYGGIEINKTKKKVNYTYDVTQLFKDIIAKENKLEQKDF